MQLSPYSVLILLSCIVILSYGYDLIAHRFRFPAVLLLLATGMVLRQASGELNLRLPNTQPLLELFGIIGLILIVLEGALDLKLRKEKTALIRSSFFTALVTLLVTSLGIATLIRYQLDVPFRQALVNAIPLGVISSAIAIPSVQRLSKAKSEFIVYESTFSDILGVMLFNYVVQNEETNLASVGHFGISLVLIFIISVVCVLFLMFLIERLKFHAKFFLIISVLILIYALGKTMHLSSLVLVLAFGLALNNSKLIVKGWLDKFFTTAKIEQELVLVKTITSESAFLIRTFFFVLFGFSVTLADLTDLHAWVMAMLIFTIILVVRLLYLHFIAQMPVLPALFVAPRGLITVMLFYSIPAAYLIPGFSQNVLFLVVILTAVLMLIGLQLREARE